MFQLQKRHQEVLPEYAEYTRLTKATAFAEQMPPNFSWCGRAGSVVPFSIAVRDNLRGHSGFLDTRFEQPPATIQNVPISTPQESLTLVVKRLDCL